MKRPGRSGSSYNGHQETSHARPPGQRTLTESLPPIQAKVVARLAAQPAGDTRLPTRHGGKTPRGSRPDLAADAEADKPVPVVDMEASVRERLRTLWFEHAWDAETLFDDDEAYEQTRNATVALFTGKELAVHYVGGGKDHTLNELIHNLFDATGTCHRLEAASFLGDLERRLRSRDGAPSDSELLQHRSADTNRWKEQYDDQIQTCNEHPAGGFVLAYYSATPIFHHAILSPAVSHLSTSTSQPLVCERSSALPSMSRKRTSA